MLKCLYFDFNSKCQDEEIQALYDSLIKDRRAVVDKLKNLSAKKKQIMTGAFLQYVLCKHLQLKPGDLVFSYSDYGKPGLKMPGVHFNLSHSGDYAMIVLSDRPVGVDIEGRKMDITNVAKRFFCKEEYEDIMRGKNDKEVADRFLKYWTLKEAYVKYLGRGLSVPLNAFKLVCKEGSYRVVEGDGDDENRDFALPQDVILDSHEFLQEYRYSICFEPGCMTDFLFGDLVFFNPEEVKINAIMNDLF